MRCLDSHIRKKGLPCGFWFSKHLVDPRKRSVADDRGGVAAAIVVGAVGALVTRRDRSGGCPRKLWACATTAARASLAAIERTHTHTHPDISIPLTEAIQHSALLGQNADTDGLLPPPLPQQCPPQHMFACTEPSEWLSVCTDCNSCRHRWQTIGRRRVEDTWGCHRSSASQRCRLCIRPARDDDVMIARTSAKTRAGSRLETVLPPLPRSRSLPRARGWGQRLRAHSVCEHISVGVGGWAGVRCVRLCHQPVAGAVQSTSLHRMGDPTTRSRSRTCSLEGGNGGGSRSRSVESPASASASASASIEGG